MLQSIAPLVVETIDKLGYVGVFFLMLVESTFIPLPSEVVLTPAGYLIYKGKFDPFMVIIASATGSLMGSLLTYYLGLYVGRPLIERYGRYVFFDEKKLKKGEEFFSKYGNISIFIARLLPGVRHYISFPAGIAKMNLYQFSLFTFLGATLWTIVLLSIGFYVGEKEELIKKYTTEITIGIVLLISIFVILKLVTRRFNNS